MGLAAAKAPERIPRSRRDKTMVKNTEWTYMAQSCTIQSEAGVPADIEYSIPTHDRHIEKAALPIRHRTALTGASPNSGPMRNLVY